LKRLWLNGNQLGDQIVGDMLNAIASSPSAASALEMLWLTTNQLTQIPAQMDSFSQLMQLDLSNNSLPALIASGSFVFNAPVDYLYLESDGISSIEPDAFQGDCPF
jgi:Leucine-rich repeat (LRR) protein